MQTRPEPRARSRACRREDRTPAGGNAGSQARAAREKGMCWFQGEEQRENSKAVAGCLESVKEALSGPGSAPAMLGSVGAVPAGFPQGAGDRVCESSIVAQAGLSPPQSPLLHLRGADDVSRRNMKNHFSPTPRTPPA